MSELGLGIAWCGNIPAWMPPVLGKEQSGYVLYTRRRIDSKEMNYVPFTKNLIMYHNAKYKCSIVSFDPGGTMLILQTEDRRYS